MSENDNEQSHENMQQEINAEHDDEIQCRIMLPSILNKSAIHAVNFSNSILVDLPTISPNTQKLILNYNMLSVFPTGLTLLKEISISNNCIERLPDEINTMQFLRVIRANNNQISILPHLKFIRHLQLNKNPIKLITTKLSQTRLQYITFDWLPFLIINNSTIDNHNDINNDQLVFYELCDIIARAHLQTIQQFVGFDVLFQVNNSSKNDTDVNIAYLLHRAITRKTDFFIDFLKNNFGHVNYNHLHYGEQLLLQEILQQKYDKALELFKLRRSNLNEAEIFMSNMLMACKYNNMELFNYMVKNGLRRHIIQQNEEEIIETIFRNFELERQSDAILTKILHLANFTRQNRKVFHLPRNYSLREAENISEGILFVLKSDTISQIFSFQFAVWEDILEPLLHFAMASRRSGLVKIILEKFRSPFVKNYAGKLAKTIRGSTLCRKLIMKYEKMYIKQRFQQKMNNEVSSPLKEKINSERWFEIVYDKEQKQKFFGTPIKYKSFDETVCMGSKLHSAERSIHKRNVLPHRMKNQSKPKLHLSISFSIPNINTEQQTGILYDFALANDKTLPTYIPHHNKMNNLILYQAYQQKLTFNLEKDYEPQNKNVVSRSFIFSPLSICQDVQYDEQEREEYFKMKNNCREETWQRKCTQRISEVGQNSQIDLNQQF